MTESYGEGRGVTILVRGNREASLSRSQLRLRLLQPEPHVHLAVHRRRGGQVLPRLLALARAPVELTEAEVAVGDERAHAKFGREGKGPTIRGFCVLRVRGISA